MDTKYSDKSLLTNVFEFYYLLPQFPSNLFPIKISTSSNTFLLNDTAKHVISTKPASEFTLPQYMYPL